MCLGFFQQGEEVRPKPSVSAETVSREGLKDEHRGEAPAPEAVEAERKDSRLVVLMEHDFGGPDELFKARRKCLQFNSPDTGLCLCDSCQVRFERGQNRAGVTHTAGDINESSFEVHSAFAVRGVLLDL